MKTNILLANAVFLFHIIVVLFILFAPFSTTPAILFLHVVSCISLIVHWWGNSDTCSLSVLESNLRGIERSNTFTHQFIAPVYNITATEWSNIVWIITFIVMFMSIFKLYNSSAFKNSWNCYINSSPKKTMYESFRHILHCFEPIFRI